MGRPGASKGREAWHRGRYHNARAPQDLGFTSRTASWESSSPDSPKGHLSPEPGRAPLPAPCSPNQLLGPSRLLSPNKSWRPWRQRLLNFSRRGGPGTPFPWHQGTRVTAREIPGAPRLWGTNAPRPSSSNSARGYQAAGINFPEAPVLLSIPPTLDK